MPNNGQNRWRTQPMYSFAEVAHLSQVSVSTVRNWLLGYTTAQREVQPLFKGRPEDEKSCSFLQLIEIVVAARFRKAEHESFRTVRRAYDNARSLYNLSYPFAHMRLKAIGGHIVHIMHDPEAISRAIDQPEQYTLPGLVLEIIEDQLEFELDLAAKWYPAGKKIPIVVDPQVSAGLPVIKGRGITVGAIYDRLRADQKIEFIEKDFELEPGIVEEVIRLRLKEQVSI